MNHPRVHLVTYATRRFRHRQWLLEASARANGAADVVHSWTPEKVAAAGFRQLAPDIRLDERGSGYWAWKPFIISEAYRQAEVGDLIFYCDIGRRYPFKLLANCLPPFLDWMDSEHQDVMPGILIPWEGPMSVWTKREAFLATGLDSPQAHSATPIQASFSIWRIGPRSQKLLDRWLDWCMNRQLVSDDRPIPPAEDLKGFHDHRHDQSLLTLACLELGIRGLDIGPQPPAGDSRDPNVIAKVLQPSIALRTSAKGRLLKRAANLIAASESMARKVIKFNKPLPQRTADFSSSGGADSP